MSRLLDRVNRLFDAHIGAWAEVGFLMFLFASSYAVREFGWSVLWYVIPAAVGYRLIGRWVDDETR